MSVCYVGMRGGAGCILGRGHFDADECPIPAHRSTSGSYTGHHSEATPNSTADTAQRYMLCPQLPPCACTGRGSGAQRPQCCVRCLDAARCVAAPRHVLQPPKPPVLAGHVSV